MQLKLTLLLTLCLTLIFSNKIFSQEEGEVKKDTTIYIDEDYEINIDETDDEDDFFDLKEFRFRLRKASHPFLKLQTGLNQFSHKSAINSFKEIGNLEVQLGYTRSFKKSRSYITSTKDRFISFSLNNKNLLKSNKTGVNELSNYQFSFGNAESFGYRLGSTQILFGNGKEFNWTNTNFDRSAVGLDTFQLDFYRDATKFGEAYNSEFSIHLFDFVSLQANYKFGLIFPRHLFWKHLGSIVIEEVAKGLLNEYLKKIFDMRPAAGPIMNFLLKSSITYLIYEFKKERMHWPFKTVQPLTYEIYSIGLKLTF